MITELEGRRKDLEPIFKNEIPVVPFECLSDGYTDLVLIVDGYVYARNKVPANIKSGDKGWLVCRTVRNLTGPNSFYITYQIMYDDWGIPVVYNENDYLHSITNVKIQQMALDKFPVKMEARGGWGTEADQNEEKRNIWLDGFNNAKKLLLK